MVQKTTVIVRRYDSIKNYVGENKVYEAGDVLYVSTKNNNEYDLIMLADGVSNFRTLLNNGSTFGGQKIIVTEEDDGETLRVKIINT